MSVFLEIQASRPPDNHYFNEAIVSWSVEVDGLHGTTGIIQPGFRGEFDIPNGGEVVRLLKPEEDEQIEFDILTKEGKVVNSMILAKAGEVFVPEGRDRLITPLGQAAVHYLCKYPGRPVAEEE